MFACFPIWLLCCVMLLSLSNETMVTQPWMTMVNHATNQTMVDVYELLPNLNQYQISK